MNQTVEDKGLKQSTKFWFTWSQGTSHYLVAIGFFIVLLLMLVTLFIVLNQFQSVNRTMAILVEETNAKTQAANSMRDSIRLRSNSLKKMRLLSDIFDRDDELLRFYGYAGIYREAHETLLTHTLDESERNILQRLTALTRSAQPANNKAASMLMDSSPNVVLLPALHQAESLQTELLGVLDGLVKIENRIAKEALESTNEHNQRVRIILFLLIGTAVFISSLIAFFVIQINSQKKREIEYQASHDFLTGLINRGEFEYRVSMSLRSAKIDKKNHALMYIDLDQFKVVNDTCGHTGGDELLRQISYLLEKEIRQTDTLGRLGGDEFGLLLNGCDITNAGLLGEKLRDTISGFRFSWEGKTFSIGASIGVVPITSNSGNVKEIFVAADEACYTAKDSGRNLVHIYDPRDEKQQKHKVHIEWVTKLQQALDENRLQLYMQPIFAIDDKQHYKYAEILVRMIDSDGTVHSPGSFLPAAERYGRITDIDRWVVKNTVKWMEKNQERYGDYRLAINLSGRSIGNVEFRAFIKETLSNTSISPACFCFEITETAAIASFKSAVEFITELKTLGCSFALDDFGSGLSSFGYLKQLPVDILKIDGVFVRNIDKDPLDYAMVKSINEIGHIMGKKTVAEFVESDSVIEKLEEIGVDYIQGYALAKPSPLP